MASPVVLDLETQKIFQEVAGDVSKLGISVVGLYNFADNTYKTYFESELNQLFPVLENASKIIGFNIIKFDLPVLKPYYVGEMSKFNVLDLLEDVKTKLGRRIALDDIAKETLKTRKQGHGLLAINYYREGNFKELAKYCLSDVKITKEIYDYGKKYGKIYYLGPYGRVEIPVSWSESKKNTPQEVNLTLPL